MLVEGPLPTIKHFAVDGGAGAQTVEGDASQRLKAAFPAYVRLIKEEF